jgi:MFS family permease
MSSSIDSAASPSKLTLILFAASILFLFADQNLLAPNLTAVARDFGFDDAQRDIKLGGQIPFAFFVVGGAVSVVVGPLADVMNRKNLYVWTCLVGTIPCLLTYWVQTFNQFFVLRTLTGVAVGGAFPLIYSLAADITTPDQRALASSLITISMGLGSTLGQGVAGFVGPTYGWRLPFVIIAIPSIFVISLVVLTMEEPPRSTGHQQQQPQQQDGARIIQVEEAGVVAGGGGEEDWAEGAEEGEEAGEEEEERGPSLARLHAGACTVQLRKFLDVFIIKTNLLAFCQSMPGCLPWGVISAFLTDYLHEQRGMTVEGATTLMFVFGLGCFAGNLAGGILGQWVYNRSKEAAAILMAATTALGFLPMAWLINAKSETISTPGGGFTLIAAVVAFSGGIAAFTGPLVRAFVMQVNSSRNRGTVFSVFMVADDLGKGLGPAIVSLLIPKWGRLTAFNISLGGWILCAVFLGLLAFTIRPDEEALIKQLEEEARQQNKQQQQQQQQGLLALPVVRKVNGVQSVYV